MGTIHRGASLQVSLDRTTNLWDLAAGRLQESFTIEGSNSISSFSPDGR